MQLSGKNCLDSIITGLTRYSRANYCHANQQVMTAIPVEALSRCCNSKFIQIGNYIIYSYAMSLSKPCLVSNRYSSDDYERIHCVSI